ncbi:MAG: DUF3311 domain-containing protein [Candidatus Eremiobacteraeota bacterium]|nr:DUF3311 domain-containing protein [Candidatus Eremiobacteraeota bacterium]
MRVKLLRAVLALLPTLMLSVAVPFVNRIEPRVFGLPFILAWIVFWVLLTPVFLYSIYRLEGRS